MSTGKLKAQYNRVRTSTALHTTSIWENTIGLQQDQAGTNSAIEASIYAPGGGGRGRDAKRQRAQELIEATGFQPSVRDFDQLKALARRSGGDAAALNRGACKICGGLGHLTKQCRNFLDKGGSSGAAAAAAAGEGGSGAGAAGGGGDRGLLTHADDEALLLNSDSSMESSDLGSGSDSDRERKRRRKEKSSRDKEGGSSKKHKKEKRRSEKKHKKEKKHKRERERDSRRSRSRSRSPDRSDRRRERSRSLDRRA